jgi:hypothetical protein
MLLILVPLTRHLQCAGSADFLPAGDQAKGQAAVPITTVTIGSTTSAPSR